MTWDIDDPRLEALPDDQREAVRAAILDMQAARESRDSGAYVSDDDGNVYMGYANNRAGRRQFERHHKKPAASPGAAP